VTSNRLLSIDHLRVELPARSRSRELRTAIHDVTLSIDRGQAVGLVGESGSGKSMTTRAVMRLLPPGAKASGGLTFKNESVLDYSRKQLADYRAHKISMIYQDPRAHTNPLLTIGDFLVEGVVAAGQMSRSDALDYASSLLAEVGVPDAGRRMRQYPHQLSGGLLQRMMIVMALMPSPELILADEPTTALDVTVQSEVMAILGDQIRERSLGMLFITHDLDLAAAVTNTLAVMYAGAIVERGPSDSVYSRPRHPYTAALLGSRPSAEAVKRLTTIPGRPISAFEAGHGCVFAARCPFAMQRCREERPQMRQYGTQSVACHRAEEVAPEILGGMTA
jgi:peptide/nickel transport system ATP-binding protein